MGYYNKKLTPDCRIIPPGLADIQAIDHLRPGIVRTVQAHPELSPVLQQMKETAIANLDQLLPQAIAAMEQRGFQVYLAENNQAAADYIANLVGEGLVVKSKTNTGKEIAVTSRLQQQGATVYETDLGDRLAQLEGKGKSAHTLAPACHLTRVECAQLLARDLQETLSDDPELLVGAARRALRAVFLQAEVGISGANALQPTPVPSF